MDATLVDTRIEAGAEHGDEHDGTLDDHAEDELLVEEVSIDGMCGVY